jgi:hypothetical protein
MEYKEKAKEKIGESLKTWLVETYPLTIRDIEIHHHKNMESYITIEVDTTNISSFSWNTERVRRVVRENTDNRVGFVDLSGSETLHVAPE